MGNPILNMLDGAQQPTTTLPTSLDDPRMAEAKSYVQSHGGDPKTAFYNLCKEKMLNPNNIINMVMGQK